jgi:hypothetical protein
MTLKAAEGLHLMSIAAANGHRILRTYTKQAFLTLYCNMDDDIVYIRPPEGVQIGGQKRFLKKKSLSWLKESTTTAAYINTSLFHLSCLCVS